METEIYLTYGNSDLYSKYRPSCLKELFLPEVDKQKILATVKEKKPMIFHGGPGVGKTSIAYAVSKELNMDLIDINSSDTRRKSFLENILERVQMKSWKSQLFFFDEADSMSAGSYSILNKILGETQHPIFIAANEDWKLPMDIRKRCRTMKIKPPTLQNLVTLVKYVAEKENKVPSYTKITSGDDYRTALSKSFYNSDSIIQTTRHDDVKNYFTYLKVPKEIDLIWLMDNLDKFYYGKALIQQAELIRVVDKYHQNKLLEYGTIANKRGYVETPYFVKRRNIFRRK